MFPPEKISRRVCPRHQYIVVEAPREELSLELVPLDQKHTGFERRIAPVTREELDAMNLVRRTAATQAEVQS